MPTLWQNDGFVLDWINNLGSDVAAGDIVALGDTIFIASIDIEINAKGVLVRKGIWLVPKVAGLAYETGDAMFYDADTGYIDNNPMGVYCGISALPAAADAVEHYVSLGGPDPRRPQSVWAFTNGSGGTLDAGDGYMVEDKLTVAMHEILDTEEGLGSITGVHSLPKQVTVVISQGHVVYWDAAAGEIDITDTNKPCGYAYKAAAGGDANILVSIGNIWV